MKRTLIIGLVTILTLVAVSLGISSSTDNTAYVQELEIGEVIENRTQTSKTYYLGKSADGRDRFALDILAGDPTLEVQVGASADDGYAYSTTFMGDYSQLRMGSSNSSSIRAFARFTDVIIPADAIIGANCYASFFVWSSTQPGVYLKVKADDSANPDAPTDATEVFAITPTTAGVDWDDQADVDDWANTPDIQSVIAELQASYDYSAGASITIIVDDDESGNGEILYSWSWDHGSLAPKLHIEYTEAGAAPPTVTPQAATNIEATTATGNGTITATGGENATIHGIEWDIDTGAPYANDVHTHGDFGVGAFEDYLTGLPTGTTIYCRSYTTNTAGTGYGGEVNFLTKPAAPTNVSATDGAHIDRVVVTWTKSTGATSYRVYEGVNLLDTLGDIATFDDNTAPAGTITQGNTVASDGTDTAHIDLSLAGTSANNGVIRTYKVGAFNATGDSVDSATDTGYRGVGVLTYQWQRSAGDGDAGYDDIVGAVAATYEDVDAPEGTVTPGTATASDGTSATYVTLSVAGEQGNDGAGRYYQCVLSTLDATGQTSGSNRGYRATGAITYQWQRSATDSDANYAPLGGATTDPYNDTNVPESEGRWYYCEISATGVVAQDTTYDRGYLGDPGITTDEAEPLSVGYIILRIVPIVIAGVVCIFVIRRNMSAVNLLFGVVIGLLAFIIASAIIKLVGV